jgi:hypothetical protein
MKKNVIFLWLIIFLLALDVQATHIIGGEITYNRQANNSYCFQIKLYTDPTSPADSPTLDLFLGDGGSILVQRTSRVVISPFATISVYETCHTYTNSGSYRVSITEANRQGNSTNLGNSVNQGFFLESFVLVNNATIINYSPEFIAEPIFQAIVKKNFRYNLTAYDKEGDSLSYALITPRINASQNASPYFIPDDFKINPISGEISWNPEQVGRYNFAILVSKWRNGIRLGYVIREISIIVIDRISGGRLAKIEDSNVDLSNPNGVRIEPGQTVQWRVILDAVASSINQLFGASEIINNQIVTYGGSNPINGNFVWQPEARHVRRMPYLVVFRTIVDNVSLDKTILLYVGSPVLNPDEIVAANDESEYKQKIKVFPNPVNDKIKFKFDFSPQNLQLTISDQTNQFKYNVSNIVENEVHVDLQNFKSGVYFYQIRQGQKLIYQGKFIKQ